MDAILVNIVSTLMLPLFLVMILCAIAGAKPEPVVKALIDLLVTTVAGLFKLAGMIIEAAFGARRRRSRDSQGFSSPCTEYPRRQRTGS